MTADQDAESSDSRLEIVSMISEAVRLFLVHRDAEDTLTSLQRNDPLSYPSNMEYILKNAEVGKIKQALNAAIARLAALPHTPADVDVVDLVPLRTWIDAHREQFDEFKRFCDEYRPPSPMEEGELHPRVDALLSHVKDLETRAGDIANLLERRKEPPEAADFRRRVEVLNAMHWECTAEFSRAMGKMDFSELSEEGQRVAIQQHVLRVARDTLDWMFQIKERDDNAEGIFWLEPLVRWEGEDRSSLPPIHFH